jgi:hypothetical protein
MAGLISTSTATVGATASGRGERCSIIARSEFDRSAWYRRGTSRNSGQSVGADQGDRRR